MIMRAEDKVLVQPLEGTWLTVEDIAAITGRTVSATYVLMRLGNMHGVLRSTLVGQRKLVHLRDFLEFTFNKSGRGGALRTYKYRVIRKTEAANGTEWIEFGRTDEPL